MNRELLNKAAEEQANYSTHWSWGDRKECFISGAEWLMQQPLSERLTDEEKEKIKGSYKDSELLELYGVLPSDRVAGRNLCLLLTDIFDSDLFKEK